MARQILASVGAKGVNRTDDVITVQDLLNNVPEKEGGPKVKLKIDGICGPKTKSAIQNFQLKHFGWAGADSRVDPNKQTLAKLNEFDSGNIIPTGVRFQIRRNWDMPFITNTQEDWFWYFEVVEEVSGSSAIYYFGNRNRPRQKPTAFVGRWSSFVTRIPYLPTGLECQASYTTMHHPGIAPTNLLNLNLLTPVSITGFRSCLFFAAEGPEKRTYDMGAEFILVK